MNPDQVQSQVRLWLSVFGTIAGALGWTWFDGVSAAIAGAAGPMLTLGMAIWSLVANKQAARVAAVAMMPEVKKIELHQTEAALQIERATPANVAIAR